MFVGRGGIEPPSSDFQSAALTTSATTPKFHLFNCHKWQNLNMSFLTHFSLFSQSYFCYIYIILQIFSKSKQKKKKKIRHKSRFLSLLRLISGIYVVFNLNSIFYVRNNLNDCLSFSHAISLPIKLLEMRGKLLYVLCKFFIFFYLYIFFFK